MICKKCRTAINDGSKICTACGKSVRNHSVKWKCLAAVLTGVAVAAAFVLGGYGEALPDEELGTYYEVNITSPVRDVVIRDNIGTGGASPPTPTSQANVDRSIYEVWAMLDEVSGFINEYYDYFSQTILFLSKNGYLFDSPAGAYVFLEGVRGLIDIDDIYLEEGILFFYLRPADLAQFRSLNVSEREELVIFTGFETREGFAITGRGEQGGIISREDLVRVLDGYSWNHGDIRPVDALSDTFDTVMRVIADYTDNRTGFDIRHMYRDDRFICIVASPTDEPLNISMFIVEYLEGAAFVRLSSIENINNPRRAINNAMPNLNQDILPIYDLRQGLRELVDDFEEIIYAMIGAEFIAEYDLLSFASGTARHVYFEFYSGLKFLGNFEGEAWRMYQVEDHLVARALLYDLSRRPPLFIIRQS